VDNVTERFTDRAAAYAAGRPSYPPEALDFIFAGAGDPARLTVADLGAGTGISSRLLAERGAAVFAIEPNAQMRSKGGAIPGVTWVDAPAERTGLASASIDVTTAFQAFHWFERPAAFEEIARISRPGASAAAVYYERDESDEFTAAYGAIVRRFATDETEQRRADALAAFEGWSGWTSVRRTDLRAEHVVDERGFRDRLASSSYLPSSGAAGDAMFAQARALFERSAAGGRVRMVLVTTVVAGRLP
jgi:SAM-dependent methyltransferase